MSTNSKLVTASENQRNEIIAMVNDNIDLLKNIGREVEKITEENGGDHMQATLEVIEKHGKELEALLKSKL